METNIKLVDELNIISKQGFDKTIPDYIESNLNPNFVFREYQKEALARLRFYIEGYYGRQNPVHLLFHMATGSGKTLLMASNILYLYSLGYRNFIFFVNSSNVIKKTQSNFLDKSSSKYLFAERLLYNEKEIEVNEVENFETAKTENINIIFTTIQALHTRLNSPQENAVTYEDFKDKKIVFLSDEAHHINTLTKSKLDKEEQEESKSWEYTVNKIFNTNNQNIMLEYTATVELSHPAVAKKYSDKIIFQYTLKDFRVDGFSKDVQLLQSDWDVKDRVLQAVILSQYRRKIAEKNKIQLKPVILFKSKQIKDSEEFEKTFHSMMKNLNTEQIERIASGKNNGTLHGIFDFFRENRFSHADLVKELQEDFSEEKCLIINSKADSEEKQIKVNTLEDYNNEVRAIFTTNMLNEGWDVLNLYDIVRLYETRDAKSNIAGGTTIAEAQLIGRGARYYPFQVDNQQEKFKRKFDKDIDNELRILEEMHYHSLTDSRYIAELRQELINIGITPDNRVKRTLSIKDTVKRTEFWRDGLIFLNKQVVKDYSSVKSLSDIAVNANFKHRIRTGHSSETNLFENEDSGLEDIKKKTIQLSSFNKHILRKAIDKNEFYRFDNLLTFFPNLKSIDEFISSESYSGCVYVELSARNGKLENLSNEDRFQSAVQVYKELAEKISKNDAEYVGTKEFFGHNINVVADKPRVLEILVGGDDKEFGIPMSETPNEDLKMDLSTQEWFMQNENYGTSEEKYLIHFIRQAIDDLQERYKDVYLLRNEKMFKIYRFSDGKAIEPDFVLFLRSNDGKNISYQLFIEPKGNRGLIEDKWKEDFLREIQTEYAIETLFEKGKYKLIGLPFYNEQNTKQEFAKEFNEKLL